MGHLQKSTSCGTYRAPWLRRPVDPWKSPSPLGVGALNLTPAPTLSQARSFTPTTPHSHTPINERVRASCTPTLARAGWISLPQLIPHFAPQTDAASRRRTGSKQLPTGITTVDSAGTLGQKRIAADAASSSVCVFVCLEVRCSPLVVAPGKQDGSTVVLLFSSVLFKSLALPS